MNADYSRRIFDWFYRGGKPPYLEIGNTLSSEAMQDAVQQYLPSAQRIQQGLLDSPTPAALLSALATQHPPVLKYNSSN
jgi:hypothetical protein